MKVSKTSLLEIIKSIVEVNDVIVIKIYRSLEKKPITVDIFEKTVHDYRKVILKNFKKGDYQLYIPFFPVLELFDNQEVKEISSDEISLSSGQHYAFGALKKKDSNFDKKKIGDRILWDLFKNEQVISDFNLKNYKNFLDYLKQNKDLLEFIDALGGSILIQNFGQSNKQLQRQNVLNVPDEFYSITQSDDLRNIFYLELINLSEKDLEIIFLKKVVDKNLVTYLLRKELDIEVPNLITPYDGQRRWGSIIVLLDTSGSMRGVGEIISKYIALLMVEVCLPKKRNLIITSFSMDYLYLEINHNETPETVRHKVLNFLNVAYYGGTNISLAFEKMMEKIITREDFFYSDLVIISDFLFKNPIMNVKTQEYYNAFKKRNNRVIGVEISGNNYQKQAWKHFLDEHFVYFYNWENSTNILEKFEADFRAEESYDNELEHKRTFNGFFKKISHKQR